MTDLVIAMVVAIVALGVVLLHWLAWQVLRLVFKAVGFIPAVRGSRVWRGTHPVRAWFAMRFPRVYGAFRARLDPHTFTGLPLTLMSAAAIYLVALLGGLIEDVLENDTIVNVDLAVNRGLDPVRADWLIDAFLWITALGAGPGLCAAAIIATAFLWAHSRPGFIVPLWLTFVGSQATTYLGKYALGRDRPEFIADLTVSTPSFPSGHATGAIAVYGFLAYAIARDLPRLRDRFEVAFWTIILVLLVGFSRMMLGVHYLSDVLSGFLVGGFWLLAGFVLVEWTRAGTGGVGSPDRPLSRREDPDIDPRP